MRSSENKELIYLGNKVITDCQGVSPINGAKKQKMVTTEATGLASILFKKKTKTVEKQINGGCNRATEIVPWVREAQA